MHEARDPCLAATVPRESDANAGPFMALCVLLGVLLCLGYIFASLINSPARRGGTGLVEADFETIQAACESFLAQDADGDGVRDLPTDLEELAACGLLPPSLGAGQGPEDLYVHTSRPAGPGDPRLVRFRGLRDAEQVYALCVAAWRRAQEPEEPAEEA